MANNVKWSIYVFEGIGVCIQGGRQHPMITPAKLKCAILIEICIIVEVILELKKLIICLLLHFIQLN